MGFEFTMLPVPCVMGILNVTPDSFSDGGKFLDAGAATDAGLAMVRAGARILDLGAEASSFFRPGVKAVDAGEQWRRLQPVFERLRAADAVLSVDTRLSEVARR